MHQECINIKLHTLKQSHRSTQQQLLYSNSWLLSCEQMRRMQIIIFVSLVGSSLASTTIIDYQSTCACITLRSLANTTYGPQAELIRQNLTMFPADQAVCDSWTAFPNYKISVFADGNGQPTTVISKGAGLFLPDIHAFCGPRELEQVSGYSPFPVVDFSQQLTRHSDSPLWILLALRPACSYRG
jgi:hypothetical protein